jgi:hypothetical protein
MQARTSATGITGESRVLKGLGFRKGNRTDCIDWTHKNLQITSLNVFSQGASKYIQNKFRRETVMKALVCTVCLIRLTGSIVSPCKIFKNLKIKQDK